jgi:hypothetical protein
MNRFQILLMILVLLFPGLTSGTSRAWYDQTHLAVARAAGYPHWYNAAAADIAKIKAGPIEDKNHFFNNDPDAEVTAKTVLDQAGRYNDPKDNEGHLYGAIISSLREFGQARSAGQYAEYHMAYAAHYIGDLSQPLHNIPHDNFNKKHHARNDGIVDDRVLSHIGEIQKNMHEITLRPDHFEADLAEEIAKIANRSHQLGLKLRAENRDMTDSEAYAQLGLSAALLKAVLKALGES